MDAPTPPDVARWRIAALGGVLVALVVAGFGHTVHDFFVGDDFIAVYFASRVTTLSEALDLDGQFRTRLIREVFPDFAADSMLIRPLPALSFWFDWLRSGRDPSAFHLSSLLLHALNVLLVAALAHALTRSVAAAATAGSLFALHPAHPEAVVWAAARSDVMVLPFMLLALLCWLRYLRSPGRGALALALAGASFAGALASKEMAAALPGVALALALAVRPVPWRRAALGTLALAGVLLAYVAFRLYYVGSLRSYYQPSGGILGAAANSLRFLRDATLASVWPGDRVAHADPDGLRFGFLAAGLALAALGAGALRRWLPTLGACALAFAVSCAPVALFFGVLPNGEGSRLIYPSLTFVAVAAGVLAAPAFARRRPLAGAALLALVLTALFGLWRALEPWQRAAATMRHMVEELATVAAGKQTLVVTNELPRSDGPAYLAQNAFPSAAWLFVRPGIEIVWLTRAQWDAAVVEHKQRLVEHPEIGALRWDGALRRWVGPDGR